MIAARPVSAVWIYLYSTSVPLEALSRRRIPLVPLGREMRGFFRLRGEPDEVREGEFVLRR